ncbi:alpha-hydroxy acid oxidase [Sphingomonas solaris]|uniref:Alpha-hydroxy-acid oxidizing protein n=1 Tax=Alterirhizorhabdus solaris TaxID=2529389 RepID=A0A558R3J5_9SPHN|nr:alpha-hydroxy acid oxidase [Sphingomonas solaris]TVV73908.1 alpha-hydroxy-acid oxidizing protein [Sphingomonas solaris]
MAFTLRLSDPAPPVSVEAWRRLARRRLPDLAWNYLDGGADDLVTVNENMAGFLRHRLRQRCLTGVRAPDLSATMAGERVALPIALAPTGAAGLSHWTADVAATRAAERAGTRAVLSTASSYTLEEVAEATEQNHWFQLYPFGNRDKVGALIARARAAGYTALFVTVDVPVVGNREGERTAGMTQPWTLTPPRLLNMARRPGWLHAVFRRRRVAAVHYVERAAEAKAATLAGGLRRAIHGAGDDAIASAENQARYMQGDLHWDDLAWMRDQWQGPLYVKGVLDPDDAAQAVDRIGADGIVVSNHGGRQLDRTLAAIDALPAIVARVGDRAEVYLDGGVRRGTDVVTALCLGARGVFIGRPYLYGLAVAGEAGGAVILEIFRAELERALVLMGCPGVGSLDRSWLAQRPGDTPGAAAAPPP